MLSDGMELVVVFGSVIVSVILHEVMHGLVALKLGDDTAHQHGRLTLNPLKHVDPVGTLLMPLVLTTAGLPPLAAAKPVPFNMARVKWGEFGGALVAIAGPLTNLVLAVIAGLWIRFTIGVDSEVTIMLEVWLTFMLVNLSLFVFNMIPFPPLDGSRILYAFAPEALQNAMRAIERGGMMIFLFFFLFIFQPLAGGLGVVIEDLLQLILGI